MAVIFAENVQCPSRHRERDSGGAGDWGKESMAHAGSPPTRHREEQPGVREGLRRGDLRICRDSSHSFGMTMGLSFRPKG
ncbi:MAG TPA: hypothetical protein PLZ55_15660, partial [bacterium]|nr:hypothetical protein [bacterium]